METQVALGRWSEGRCSKAKCRNWTVVTLNPEGWRKLLKEAEAHPGM